MTATVTVTNPPPPATLPPLPGPGAVNLQHVPVTVKPRQKPTYPVGNLHKQRRQKGNHYR